MWHNQSIAVNLLLGISLSSLFYILLNNILSRISFKYRFWLRKLSQSPMNWMISCVFIIILTFLIIKLSFIQDDAYISFRYSRNLILGNGLVWNPEVQPIQGYTNFLWTLLLSIPIALGFNISTFITFFGIISALSTIFLTFLLSLNIYKSKIKALFPTFFLSTNYSFIAYSTGGLETQFVSLICIFSWYITSFIISRRKGERLILNLLIYKIYISEFFLISLFAIVFTLGLLTRLDSLLITGPCLFILALFIFEKTKPAYISRKILILLSLPLITISIYFAFILNYYGDYLPNTFYLKANSFSIDNLRNGTIYIIQFFVFYGILPLLTFFTLNLSIIRYKVRFGFISLSILITICISFLYILKVGGDFMEFRFFVPIMPLFFIILCQLLFGFGIKISFLILSLFPFFSLLNSFDLIPRINGVESIKQLKNHLYHPHSNWIGIGKRLNTLFPDYDKGPIIGITPSGAIPYYSNLKSIDLLGLNDQHIAKNGVIIGSRPGHVRGPGLNYLYDSGINLLIGHPQVRHRQTKFSYDKFLSSFCWFMSSEDCKTLSKSRPRIVSMPIDETYFVDMIYLSRSNLIDKVILSGDLIALN